MIVSKLVEQLPGGIVGFVAGAFCPSVLKKIKALFVKETSQLKAEVDAEVKKVESKL
jgi:hypothetical protein